MNYGEIDLNDLLLYFGNVSTQVIVLFILIALGYVLTHFKMIRTEGAGLLTDLSLFIITPAVIIKAFATVEFTAERVGNLLIVALAAVLIHFFALAVGLICFKKSERAQRNLYTACVVFSNCGYMSLPLTEAVLGDEGVFLVSIYVGVFNVVLWSVGLKLFSSERLSFKKIALNPGLISVAIGLIIFFGKLNITSVKILYEPISMMAALNAPVAMLVIGYYLKNTDLVIRKSDMPIFAIIALRLVAVPLVALAVMRLCGITGTLLTATFIPASAPCAAAVMMFSAKYGADTASASKIVSFTHIASVVTMPLLLTLCKFIGG